MTDIERGEGGEGGERRREVFERVVMKCEICEEREFGEGVRERGERVGGEIEDCQ